MRRCILQRLVVYHEQRFVIGYDFSRFVLVYILLFVVDHLISACCQISSSGSISPSVQRHHSTCNGLCTPDTAWVDETEHSSYTSFGV